MRNMKIKKTGRWRRRIKWAIPIGILLIVAMTMAANYTVEYATDSLVYKEPASIPYNKVGLLLGTSKTLRSGTPSAFANGGTNNKLLRPPDACRREA